MITDMSLQTYLGILRMYSEITPKTVDEILHYLQGHWNNTSLHDLLPIIKVFQERCIYPVFDFDTLSLIFRMCKLKEIKIEYFKKLVSCHLAKNNSILAPEYDMSIPKFKTKVADFIHDLLFNFTSIGVFIKTIEDHQNLCHILFENVMRLQCPKLNQNCMKEIVFYPYLASLGFDLEKEISEANFNQEKLFQLAEHGLYYEIPQWILIAPKIKKEEIPKLIRRKLDEIFTCRNKKEHYKKLFAQIAENFKDPFNLINKSHSFIFDLEDTDIIEVFLKMPDFDPFFKNCIVLRSFLKKTKFSTEELRAICILTLNYNLEKRLFFNPNIRKISRNCK